MTDRRFINTQNLNDKGSLVEVDCRFCHIRQKYDKYDHIAPCGCAGPTRYVHRQCFQRWATVKFQHVYNSAHSGDPEQFNLFCQICQQRMEMEFVLTNKISKYQDFVEKLIGRKILFLILILLAVGLIVAVIILALFSYSLPGQLPTQYIIGFSVCCVSLVIITVIFIYNFMVVKSIIINHIANNKNPQILALGGDLDEVEEEQEESEEKDPYFGVEETKKDPQFDRSLMLQSKRDSGDAASVASKTLTDYVMQKMYRHDQPSVKGRSQKQLDSRVSKRYSKYEKRQPIKQTKDQSVQISDLQKKNAEMQYGNFQRQDISVQKTVNYLDQQIQKSMNYKNQSVQKSNNLKDMSIQPSTITKRSRRIFREDPSVLPQSSVANDKMIKIPAIPIEIQKKYISDYEQNIYFPRQYQRPMIKQSQLVSSGDSKKSEEQLVKPEAKANKQSQQKLRLKTSKDPIKIRVRF